MSRVARNALWIVVAVLSVFTLAMWAMLETLQGRIHPPCLEQVAEAPDGRFWDSTFESIEGRVTVDYDDLGPTPVPHRPQRIVSTLPGITEMIAYLGAEERLVAVSKWCDTPASVRALPQISVQPLDLESILAVKPDLVILDRRLHLRALPEIRRRLQGRVLLLDTSRSLPHLVASLDLLAHFLQASAAPTADARAKAFKTRYEALLASIESEWPDGRPRVLAVGQWDPLYVMGPGSLQDDLLRICGCLNMACDLQTDASGTFSEELVLARGATWFLTPKEPLPERLAERWKHIPAIKQGHLAPAWTDDIARGGPRILDALERLDAVLRGREPPAHLGAMK